MSTENRPSPASKRKPLMLAFGTLVVLAAVGYGAWWAAIARHHERTDDAYVQGNLVQITPQLSGTVLSIHADDTDYVQAGAPLVDLDRADAQVALDHARAALAQTVRQVRTLYANNSALAANIEAKATDVRRAESDLARAQADLKRRQGLAASGAVSGEELLHAQTTFDTARSSLAAAKAGMVAAREQLAANTALTDDTTVEAHPNVMQAAAKVHEAYLAWSRTALPAPVSGYVAKRSVQVGQRVSPGAPLMSIVPLDQVWVDANFKEVQLRDMRIGQPVTLVADLYGDRVEYHGKVAGLAAGTGSAFSLLPAQNATGNWIKIVQRLPVRITLDADEVQAHPLRVGLSMTVDVDVRDTQGTTLAEGKRAAPAYATTAFDATAAEADRLVADTIAANLGHGKTASAAPRALAARGM